MSVGHVLLLWVLFWPLMLLPGHCGDHLATSCPSYHEQSRGLKPLKRWTQVNLPARLSRGSVTTAGSWPPLYALSMAVRKGAGSLRCYCPKAHMGTQKAVCPLGMVQRLQSTSKTTALWWPPAEERTLVSLRPVSAETQWVSWLGRSFLPPLELCMGGDQVCINGM